MTYVKKYTSLTIGLYKEGVVLKKILIICLSLFCALSLCGCKNEDDDFIDDESVIVLEVSGNGSNSQETGNKQETPEQKINRILSGSVKETGKTLSSEWFDDAVFVGDSVTLKLSYYAENGELGNADFLCAGSLGYGNALMGLDEEGNVHPMLAGKKVTVDVGVSEIDKPKVFIMLGMNDIGLYGVDQSIENMKELTRRILSLKPDAEIYIQSVTPMLENMQGDDLNNKSIPHFNEKLKAVCDEQGFHYLHVAQSVADEKGYLVPEYCGDPDAMGIHFTDEGCKQWIDYLKTHVE